MASKEAPCCLDVWFQGLAVLKQVHVIALLSGYCGQGESVQYSCRLPGPMASAVSLESLAVAEGTKKGTGLVWVFHPSWGHWLKQWVEWGSSSISTAYNVRDGAWMQTRELHDGNVGVSEYVSGIRFEFVRSYVTIAVYDMLHIIKCVIGCQGQCKSLGFPDFCCFV